MLEFTSLKRDIAKIKEYLKATKNETCDTTLGVKYCWSEYLNTEYAIFENTLILKEQVSGEKTIFYYPVGENEGGAIKEVEKYCLGKGISMVFYALTKNQIEYLKSKYRGGEVWFERDWSDYIYLAEQFKTYSGKKFSGQRNHVNRFKRENPNYVFKVIQKEDIERVLEFAKEQAKSKEFSSSTEEEDKRVLPDFIRNMFSLECFGGYIEIDEKIVAVSIGEKRKNHLIVHVEKALYEYNGIYPTMAQEFALAFATEEIEYINREDDCGDIGLRTSKLQYKPIEIRHKYCFEVNTLFDKLPLNPNIKTERLTLGEITERDKAEYYSLYTDKELNAFWGYNYESDLKGALPTPEYFYDFQNSLKEKKEEFSFAVRLNDKMIGEVVLHGFGFNGALEIGFRIERKSQQKGYAYESAFGVINFVKENLNPIKIKGKCLKQNLPSKNLFTKLGFTLVNIDDVYCYFELTNIDKK